MSCSLETAACKGNICVIKALTNYRVITLSPGLLNRISLSLSFVSSACGSAAVPDIFCPGTPLGEIHNDLLCQGLAHIKFNCNVSVVDPNNCVSLLLHPDTVIDLDGLGR